MVKDALISRMIMQRNELTSIQQEMADMYIRMEIEKPSEEIKALYTDDFQRIYLTIDRLRNSVEEVINGLMKGDCV